MKIFFQFSYFEDQVIFNFTLPAFLFHLFTLTNQTCSLSPLDTIMPWEGPISQLTMITMVI